MPEPNDPREEYFQVFGPSFGRVTLTDGSGLWCEPAEAEKADAAMTTYFDGGKTRDQLFNLTMLSGSSVRFPVSAIARIDVITTEQANIQRQMNNLAQKFWDFDESKPWEASP